MEPKCKHCRGTGQVPDGVHSLNYVPCPTCRRPKKTKIGDGLRAHAALPDGITRRTPENRVPPIENAGELQKRFEAHFRRHWAFFYFGPLHTFAWTVGNMITPGRDTAFTLDSRVARQVAWETIMLERAGKTDKEMVEALEYPDSHNSVTRQR